MNLAAGTLAVSVSERDIPAFGPYSVAAVSLDLALDLIVSSTSPVAQAVNGHGDPRSVAELISGRLEAGSERLLQCCSPCNTNNCSRYPASLSV